MRRLMLVGMAAAIILYFITIGCLLSYLPVSIKSENRGVKSKNSSHSSLSEQQTTTGLVVNNAEDLSSMKSQPFRVFVYPLPPKFNQNILDNNPDCGKNMFASEVLFHHWLLNTGTFVLSSPRRVITQNPEDATLFYVPIYSTCMLTMDRPLERKKRLNPHRWQRKIMREFLMWILDHPLYSSYWKRRGGTDHVFTMSHDFGGCMQFKDLKEGVPIEELKDSIFLQYNGEYARGSSCYVRQKDLVIPPPSSFDFSNKILSGERARSLIHHRRVFFAGTIHWKWFDHYDDSYSHGVRQRLADLYQNQSFYPNVIIHDGKMELEEYFSALRASTFCLCPRGFATWSPRFVDSVAAGCIPVLIADHTDHPFSHILDYNKFSIILREEDATTSGKLMEILDSVRTEDIKRMKTELLAVQRHLSWNAEAPRWILSLLETKAKQIM